MPGANSGARETVVLYDRSFTYGTGLADDETFATHIQSTLHGVTVLNRGIGDYGTLQNYLQFRQDVRCGTAHAAVFGVISDHRFRNIAHPQRMQQHLAVEWYELGVEHVPTDDDIWDIAAFFSLSNRMANFTSMRPNDEFYSMGRDLS